MCCKSTTSAKTNKIETCAVRKACVINQPRESVNLCAMNITSKILKYKKKREQKKKTKCNTSAVLHHHCQWLYVSKEMESKNKALISGNGWESCVSLNEHHGCKSTFKTQIFAPIRLLSSYRDANCSNKKGPNPFVSRIIFSVFI